MHPIKAVKTAALCWIFFIVQRKDKPSRETTLQGFPTGDAARLPRKLERNVVPRKGGQHGHDTNMECILNIAIRLYIFSLHTAVHTNGNRGEEALEKINSTPRTKHLCKYTFTDLLSEDGWLKSIIISWVQKIMITLLKNRLLLNVTLPNIESAVILKNKTIFAYDWVHLPCLKVLVFGHLWQM